MKIPKTCHECLACDLCSEFVYRNDAICENFHIKLEAVERSDNKQMDAIALLKRVYQDLGDGELVKPDTYCDIIKMLS